jgi:hypothetical protein
VKLSDEKIAWRSTGGGEIPYEATVGGRRLQVRVNDFPAEPLYTLLVDGVEVEHLDGWPASWQRPGAG